MKQTGSKLTFIFLDVLGLEKCNGYKCLNGRKFPVVDILTKLKGNNAKIGLGAINILAYSRQTKSCLNVLITK